MAGWIEDLAGYKNALNDGSDVAQRSKINGTGTLSFVDNAVSGRTDAVLIATTVAALSAAPGAYDGQEARAECHTTRGDGGGGSFVWDADSVATANGGTILGTGTGRWLRAFSGPVRPRWFGAAGDGEDDTTALQACFATSHKTFDLEGLTYTVAVPKATFLGKWTGQTGVTIIGGGATIVDSTVYDVNGQDCPIFWFHSCTTVRVIDVTYTGAALASPATQLGYYGASAFVVSHGTSDVHIAGQVNHARHGILAGLYDTIEQGGVNNIRAKLTTYYCGYPWASGLADDIDVDLTTDMTHRAAYIAGTRGGRVTARFKNQVIADNQVLITDAYESAGVARGCRDLQIKALDTGSTTWVDDGWCVGITPQYAVDSLRHENITVEFCVVSSDTVAPRTGGFMMNYGAGFTAAQSYRNIRVSGLIDRTAQTISDHVYGEINVYGYSSGRVSPVVAVDGITLDKVVIRKGSSTPAATLKLLVPGATGDVHILNCDMPDHTVEAALPTSGATLRASNSKAKGFSNPAAAWPSLMIGCTLTDAIPTTLGTYSKTQACSIGGVTVLINVEPFITASTTQTQGQGALVALINDVTACANTNDTVTLPTPDIHAGQIWVMNNGAQTLQVFPPSGCSLGNGTDGAITLAAGVKASWAATSSTVWRRLA